MKLRFRIVLYMCAWVVPVSSFVVPARAQEEVGYEQDSLFASESSVIDYTVFEGLLKKHVREGRIDYTAWKKQDLAVFEKYVLSLADCAVGRMRANDQKAFWINAYNALAIYGVLQRLPANPWFVKFYSVKKVPGFFDAITYAVAGEELTLDRIRLEKLVARFQDPRIHCALVFPAVSAPEARNEVMRGEDVDDTVEYLTKVFLNDFRKNNVDARKGALYLSEIFSWYENDFISSGGGSIVDFVMPFFTDSARQYLKWNKTLPVEYLRFNWALNIS